MSKKLEFKYTVEELRDYLNKLVTNGIDDLFLELCYLFTKTIVYFPINEDNSLELDSELLNKEVLSYNYIFNESIPLVINNKYYQPIFIDYSDAIKDMPPKSMIVAAKFSDLCSENLLNDQRMEGLLIDPRYAQCVFDKSFIKACIEVFEFLDGIDEE